MTDLLGDRDMGIDTAKAEAALAAPFAGMADVEFFPTTEQKIAVLGYRLAKYHALPDGNKRTAWFAMRFAADAAGLAVLATADEAVQGSAFPWTTFLSDEDTLSFVQELIATIQGAAAIDNFVPR